MSNRPGPSNPSRGRSKGRGRGRSQPRGWPQHASSDTHRNQGIPGNGKMKLGEASRAGNEEADKHQSTPEERFLQASAQIHQSVQKHIGEDGEDSSSEDDMEDTGILQSTLKMYAGHKDVSTNGLDRTTQYLVDACRSGANVCLVCISKIKRLDAIWTCNECYCVLHLPCVQKWAKEGALQNHMLSEEATSTTKNSIWSCPKCRCEKQSTAVPKRYTCYCGKVIDPPFHPWLSPHSCGEMCEKPLKPQCGHKCLLLCHPGPCPPCPKMVRSSCHCGQQTLQQRRCSNKTWACGQPCGRMLSCRQHQCLQPCHAGVCDPCPRTSKQSCLCGKMKTTRQCASPQWQCDSVCDRQLSCGHHTCQQVCHSGPCGDCPNMGKRECPCGKTNFQLPCTESIPNCGDTCDKLLECGLHQCTRRCHTGPCETCRQMRVKKCRCGQRDKSIQCCKEYLCDIKCPKMRDCQRHQCKRKCCDGSCPPCEQPCGRQLPCRNHKCPSQCHTGLCYPCQEFHDIKCYCGSTSISVPCGREKVTKPPRCNKPCKVPPDCHHDTRDPHRCHFQRCPPCQQPCNKPLPSCDHRCPWQCHSAVLIKQIENKGKRAAPWDPLPKSHLTVIDKPCPPCQVPIPTECLGKHEIQDLPCARAGLFSCKKRCGRLLACSNHHCTLECHMVTGAQDGSKFGSECLQCESGCSQPRPIGCTHTCTNPCHPGPCPLCKQSFRQRCHCTMMMLHIECCKWTSASVTDKTLLSSCQGPCTKLLSCSHLCSKTCHRGECSIPEDCTHKVSVRCPCKRRKKDFPCKDVKGGQVKVECVASCKQAIQKEEKKKEDEKLKREEQDKARQQRDLEEYERLTKGKKRRERRKKEDYVQPSFWRRNKMIILIAIPAIITLTALLYIFFMA